MVQTADEYRNIDETIAIDLGFYNVLHSIPKLQMKVFNLGVS